MLGTEEQIRQELYAMSRDKNRVWYDWSIKEDEASNTPENELPQDLEKDN